MYVQGNGNGRPGNGQSAPCNWNMDWERPVNMEYMVPIKDKNGNIIYEGDILKPNGNTITKEVVYEDGSYWAKDTIYFHDKCHIFQKWIDECGYKIIGNIHKVKEEQ